MVKNKDFANDYPESIRIIRYEDMSTNPIDTTHEIYDFIEMELSPSIEQFLQKSTSKQDKAENHSPGFEFMQVYSTSRNAKQSMNGWRTKIDINLLKRIQEFGHFLTNQGLALKYHDKLNSDKILSRTTVMFH